MARSGRCQRGVVGLGCSVEAVAASRHKNSTTVSTASTVYNGLAVLKKVKLSNIGMYGT